MHDQFVGDDAFVPALLVVDGVPGRTLRMGDADKLPWRFSGERVHAGVEERADRIIYLDVEAAPYWEAATVGELDVYVPDNRAIGPRLELVGE